MIIQKKGELDKQGGTRGRKRGDEIWIGKHDLTREGARCYNMGVFFLRRKAKGKETRGKPYERKEIKI